MKSCLTDRLQRCKIGNSFSEWGKILAGVPQVSILGPLLFKIFLHDIFYLFKSVILQIMSMTVLRIHPIEAFQIS